MNAIKLLKDLQQYIPKGMYCYEIINGKRYICPFWDKNENYSEQHNGYCHYLQKGDWDINAETDFYNYKTGEKVEMSGFPFGLLWDQVKECGINEEDE